jgi:hypothetical protein
MNARLSNGFAMPAISYDPLTATPLLITAKSLVVVTRIQHGVQAWTLNLDREDP